MLRPDGHRREIRKGDCLPVSDCAIGSEKTRHGAGFVPARLVWSGRFIFSGRKIQSGFKTICGGCGFGALPILDAISSRSKMYELPPTRNGTRIDGRSRGYAACLDQAEEKAGAYRALTRRSLAATGTTGRTQVLARRTGTTLPRTRTTTSGCAAPVTDIVRSAVAMARQAVHVHMWSAGGVLLREIRFWVWQSAEYQGWETRGQHS